MEFFGINDHALDNQFQGDTLLMPSVSYANLGQLTVDLLINTLLHRGHEWNAKIVKIGHLLSDCVLPMAGSSAYTSQDTNQMCINMEVYRIPSQNITIIQQRTNLLPGRAHTFASDLYEWATSRGFNSIVVVSGADNMLRHDPNMQYRPLHIITQSKTEVRDSTAVISSRWDSELTRGCGITPLLYKRSSEQGSSVPVTACILFCAEGDNVPDAMHMTQFIMQHLNLVSMPVSLQQLEFPPSWNQLFGRGPDLSLFQ